MHISVAKIGEAAINEDAVLETDKLLAVSDGAGGGGIFADKWAKYLLDHLPEKPISSFGELQGWISCIYEPFYDEAEKSAALIGGFALDKFYHEGSFATLAAVWISPLGKARWVAFGDSVVFKYDKHLDSLEHSFSSLKCFAQPPYLLNYINALNPEGYRSGCFDMDENTILFACSDALAHYIIMMYEVLHRDKYQSEIDDAIELRTRNSNFIRAAMALASSDFFRDILHPLLNSASSVESFKNYLSSLLSNGVLAIDDYSLVTNFIL